LPVLQNLNPASGEPAASIGANVVLEIVDIHTGVAASTVILTVGGTVAWTGDTQQAGFVVTKETIPDGFRYTINPDALFPENSTITIEVYAEDLVSPPNVLDTSYTFDTVAPAPVLTPVTPLAYQKDVDKNTNIVLNVTVLGGGLDDSATILKLNGETLWTGDADVHPHVATTKTAITDGWAFVIEPETPFTEGTTPIINVHAENSNPTADILDTYYSFDVATTPCVLFGAIPRVWGQIPWGYEPYCDPTCFTGPLNEAEEGLLVPFATLDYMERLRVDLLKYVVTNNDPNEAARSIFLRAHSQETAPIMHDIVPVPTEAEWATRLCFKNTNLSVSNNLRRKPNLLPGAIRELFAMGVPHEQRKLLDAYASEDQPNTEVPLACVMVLLAKAFE
jgi:hypothetical protein